MERELIDVLNKQLNLELAPGIPLHNLQEKLSAFINELIEEDFQKLILILYKVDVSEQKLKTLLQENKNADAADIISELIIERQLQKIKSRKEFKSGITDCEEEKW